MTDEKQNKIELDENVLKQDVHNRPNTYARLGMELVRRTCEAQGLKPIPADYEPAMQFVMSFVLSVIHNNTLQLQDQIRALQAAPQQATTNAPAKRCPHCGSKDIGKQRCLDCGFKLADAVTPTKACPHCGSTDYATERRPNGNHVCNICHSKWPNRKEPATTTLRRPAEAIDGVLEFLRDAFRNDGAEGESVHALCDEVGYLREEVTNLRESLRVARGSDPERGTVIDGVRNPWGGG